MSYINYDDDYDDGGDTTMRGRNGFANPGSGSALRAASRRNPRNKPCPTCKNKNLLTAEDVRRHYQCDRCADRDEGVGY